MSNYGTSRAGRAARTEGKAPASIVAGWIGCGLTAAWIVRHCKPCEWHHAQANLGGDGKPVDYFAREDCLAAWLAGNVLAAAPGNRTARRRLPELCRLRVAWAVPAGDVGCLLRQWRADLPPVVKARAPADPLVGRWVDLSRRYSVRRASRWQRYEWFIERLAGLVTAATPATITVLIADGFRCGEDVSLRRHTMQRLDVLPGDGGKASA